MSLSPVGPAYYLLEANTAILAENAAFLLAGKLCVSACMPKPFIRKNLTPSELSTVQELKENRLDFRIKSPSY